MMRDLDVRVGLFVYIYFFELLIFLQEEYVVGESVGTLDCGHDFHSHCIKQWLRQKNTCPICKMTGIGS